MLDSASRARSKPATRSRASGLQLEAEAARAQLAERLGRIAGLDVRFVEAGEADGETDGTRLFTALSSALSDVPHDRVAGVIFITDGRVHDVPAEAAALGFAAPVHGLITGHKNERDRRVVLMTAPRFGIVGQAQTITFRVEDQGAPPGPAQVTVRRDGETIANRSVRGGANVTVRVKPTALPLNVSLIMPRCGSSENVAIMVDAGFCRYGPRARKSGIPYAVVLMKFWALGLTIMARIHGSSN